MKFYKKKIITRGDNEAYLVRYSIFSCFLFAIKVHHILKSDDTCLHDHPWAFISIILKGGYVEESIDPDIIQPISSSRTLSYIYMSTGGLGLPSKKILFGPGSILYRPAKYTHRLIIYQPAWTLVITFRKWREWGFYTPGGWTPHFKHERKNICE